MPLEDVSSEQVSACFPNQAGIAHLIAVAASLSESFLQAVLVLSVSGCKIHYFVSILIFTSLCCASWL